MQRHDADAAVDLCQKRRGGDFDVFVHIRQLQRVAAGRERERDVGVSLEKTGRGRFRLFVDRPLQLVDAG